MRRIYDPISDEAFNESLKHHMLSLLEYGWFSTRDLSLEYVLYLKNKDKDGLNEFLINFYNSQKIKVKELVNVECPKRNIIIDKALQAHNRSDFELSVPVLLAQIDGIFHDLTSKSIFSTSKRYSSRALDWVSELESQNILPIVIAILEPLKLHEILGSDFNSAEKLPDVVHRNLVLHGKDVNYGTEINSCKVISLLLYILEIVCPAVKQHYDVDYIINGKLG